MYVYLFNVTVNLHNIMNVKNCINFIKYIDIQKYKIQVFNYIIIFIKSINTTNCL